PQIEKRVGDKWSRVNMKDLQVGDTFRMWIYHKKHMKWVLHEDDGGNTEWETVSEPYIHNEYKVWTVNVKEEFGGLH
ncbi:unnamed protein product, partial [marine sediment metagenome]